MKTLSKLPGRRIENPDHKLTDPGDYWKQVSDGTWYGMTPNGLLCWLRKHHVEEHDDGTISVVAGPWGSNSILVSGGNDNTSWHGCIERGVWKEF